MYPGLPSRLERDLKQLYLHKVLGGQTENFHVCCICTKLLLVFLVFLEIQASN